MAKNNVVEIPLAPDPSVIYFRIGGKRYLLRARQQNVDRPLAPVIAIDNHSESLNVTGPLTGVVVTMTAAAAVTVRVRRAESGSEFSLQGVKATLNDLPFRESAQEGISDAKGNLAFGKPVRPGHYSINVDARSVPEGCFVQELKLGEQVISGSDFEILAPAQLGVVLSNKAGRIAGSVSDADEKPYPGSVVTLIPSDPNWRPARQPVNDDGTFQFTGLRPGKYKMFAWEEVDDDLWQDPDFRGKYENRATEIDVEPNKTASAQLRVITMEEIK